MACRGMCITAMLCLECHHSPGGCKAIGACYLAVSLSGSSPHAVQVEVFVTTFFLNK
jgi:hypothetical protein